MEVISILSDIGIDLNVDNYFEANGVLLSASFDYCQLKDTCFDFNYQNKRVLHFTSVESARLITENGYLRGSNLNNLDDNFEIIHTLKLVDDKLAINWSNIKSRTFAICFTEKNRGDDINNYTYHWENYANNHKGVALEFEFLNESLPYGFYPLKIQYMDESNDKIKSINKLSRDMTKLNEVEKEFILPILAGIKHKQFEDESEVRIMYNISEPSVEHIENSEGDDVFYSFNACNSIDLELKVPFVHTSNRSNVMFTLNKIYLGKEALSSQDNLSSLKISDHFCKIKDSGMAEIEFLE